MPSHATSSSCPACGSPVRGDPAPYRGTSPAFAALALAECGACGMVFVDPMPDEATLDAYNRGYFENAHGGMATDAGTLKFFSGIAKLRVHHVEGYLAAHGLAPRAVLEVGPGHGDFAAYWLERHPGTRYVVAESDASCHERLRALGLTVLDDASTAGAGGERFDLAVLSHVLEHTADPAAFLRVALRVLRPGSVLFVEVPCSDQRHKEVYEPHLLFFDKPAMGALLERLGLRDVKLSYHGVEIERLRRQGTAVRRALARVRRQLERRGLWVPPRLPDAPALRALGDADERRAVHPHEAHLEKEHPSWWLRALARVPAV